MMQSFPFSPRFIIKYFVLKLGTLFFVYFFLQGAVLRSSCFDLLIHVTVVWISSQQWNPDQVEIPVALLKPSQWAVIRWIFLRNILNISKWWKWLKYLRLYIVCIPCSTAVCTDNSSNLIIVWTHRPGILTYVRDIGGYLISSWQPFYLKKMCWRNLALASEMDLCWVHLRHVFKNCSW